MGRCQKIWLVILAILSTPVFANTPQQCYANASDAYTALVKQHAHAQIIDINTANAVDFVKLAGVGNQAAQAIVEYRNRHGRFGSVDDLQKVRGIGQATINKNRHRLSVQKTTK